MKNLYMTFQRLESLIGDALEAQVELQASNLASLFNKAKTFGLIGQMVGWMPDENKAGIMNENVTFHTTGLTNEQKLELIEKAAVKLTEDIIRLYY